MEPLTVVSWLWRGWRPLYTAENVNALQRMVAEHLKIPHRFVCVTDERDGVECETIPFPGEPHVPTHPRQPNCYKRLNLFKSGAGSIFGPRVLSMDLDCVIFKDITDLITDDDFRIMSGHNSPYNGSMWLLKTGMYPEVWDKFDPRMSPVTTALQKHNGRPYIGSDQAWISYMLPGKRTWGPEDGVYQFYKIKNQLMTPSNLKIVFFPGLLKPWHDSVKKMKPSFYQQYMRYCL